MYPWKWDTLIWVSLGIQEYTIVVTLWITMFYMEDDIRFDFSVNK